MVSCLMNDASTNNYDMFFFPTGIILISLTIVCKANKGRTLAEQYFTASQHIGASSLQNMFSFIPIVLTWMGSACLIGWLMWPVF